ncbi:TPA: thioesterase II family protein [Pseudomonas aeruginosa]
MSQDRISLLCFSYAGGSASFYARWQRLLPMAQVIPVDLPPRGQSPGAPAFNSREATITYLLEQVQSRCRGRFALFGHSLGGRLAFELLVSLEQRLELRAEALFVSGCLAPERFAVAMGAYERDLSDQRLLQVLQELGGTPPELMSNLELMQQALPVIRADFQLAIDLSRCPPAQVSAPIHLVLGDNDPVTDQQPDYSGWARHTLGRCQLTTVAGDHFFIRTNFAAVAETVARTLREVTAHAY